MHSRVAIGLLDSYQKEIDAMKLRADLMLKDPTTIKHKEDAEKKVTNFRRTEKQMRRKATTAKGSELPFGLDYYCLAGHILKEVRAVAMLAKHLKGF